MSNYHFLEITQENAAQEGLFCIKNPKYPGFKLKHNWLIDRFKEGLKILLLKVEGETAGFIEFVPGESAWRPVNASDYIFIHCIWVYPKKFYNKGYGSLLIHEAEKYAIEKGKAGVAVQVSKGSWMAGNNLFIKNGFTTVESKGRFDLMAKKSGDAADPTFNNWEENILNYSGLNLIFAHQCPLFIKSVEEMKITANEFGHELKVKVLDTAEQAQQAPSGYGVYSLVYNGKLLADHYISNTRFKNIITKEIIIL